MELRPVIIEQEISIPEKDLSDLLSGRKRYETFKSKENSSYHFIHKYQLEICCSKYSDNVSVKLELVMYDAFEKCLGQIAFHNESGNIVAIKDLNIDSNDCNFTYTIEADFCKLSDVLNKEKKMGSLENKSCDFAKSFIIQIKGILFRLPFRNIYEYPCPNPTPNPKKEFTLEQYLWERDDRDFILSVGKKNEQKTEVKIHKFILAFRSPVFDRMLQTDMKEKSEGKAEIIDFDPETVKIAVEFFYDREIGDCLNVGLLIDLLQFAEKYDIQDLKDKVEIFLWKKLRPENICQISDASVMSNATMLKDACIETMLFYKKIPFADQLL